MLVLGLDGWPAGTLEESPLVQTTIPSNNVSIFWTIKGDLVKSIFTLEDMTIDSPYTATTFSEETTDEGNTVVLFLYGKYAKDMKEAVQVIIEKACVLTGAPNAQIRPATATPTYTNNDREREEIQAEVSSPPITTQRDTRNKKRKKTQERQTT